MHSYIVDSVFQSLLTQLFPLFISRQPTDSTPKQSLGPILVGLEKLVRLFTAADLAREVVKLLSNCSNFFY